jgi:hypothetical protein
MTIRSESDDSTVGYWRNYSQSFEEELGAGQEAWYRLGKASVLYAHKGPFLLTVRRGEISIQTGSADDIEVPKLKSGRRLPCESGLRLPNLRGSPIDLFVRGSWDSEWSASELRRMGFQGGCYIAVIPLRRSESAYHFRIGPRFREAGYGFADFGGLGRERAVVPDQSVPLGLSFSDAPAPDLTFSPPKTGIYMFQLVAFRRGGPPMLNVFEMVR